MEAICLQPIGVVKSRADDIYAVPKEGEDAVIEIKAEYVPALQRIEENSHLWIICWFDRADRGVLQTMPRIMKSERLEFGVFALRTSNRPNPLALTLVSLEKVEGNLVYVAGLDAVGGTPVLDIKPYYEQDSVFSPRTSYVKPKDDPVRRSLMRKLAYRHHGAASAALEMGLRICLLAEDHLGHLLDPSLSIAVKGSRELADVLQGITRARLANPPRFTFVEADRDEVTFTRNGQRLKFEIKKRYSLADLQGLTDPQVFSLLKESFEQ